eukprot:TRINITY_DN4997_c0_g1_i2.p1 TRINITY_DN4997_c0_g1~~TRINITY_DN4997_c0_g1_i2.p1  ORF type:complete len:119 (-),score=6.74 TRINITY_DN4997_c0_g1_i2:19-375(-)
MHCSALLQSTLSKERTAHNTENRTQNSHMRKGNDKWKCEEERQRQHYVKDLQKENWRKRKNEERKEKNEQYFGTKVNFRESLGTDERGPGKHQLSTNNITCSVSSSFWWGGWCPCTLR